MTATFGRVAVLGMGLIGGSLMHALRLAGLEVIGYDVDPDTATMAGAAGFAVAPTDTDAVRGADLVVLAMPLPRVGDAVRSLRGVLPADAVLTDVGTLKAPVLDDRSGRERPPATRFVGGHPLAGTEESGWDGGRPAAVPGRPVGAHPRDRHPASMPG